MKSTIILAAAALFFASCESGGNASGDTAVSTSVDSVSMSGEAPVQYGPNDPANDTVTSTGTQEQVIQDNAGIKDDKYQNNSGNNPPSSPNTESNPKMQSNTMDARTSGGSAQGTGTRK